MKTIEVIVKENEAGKFEVVDQEGKVYSTCSRKYDAKRAADKNESLTFVEEFTKEEPKKVEIKARQIGKTYDMYKTFIMQNFDGVVITATGEFPREFCETFGLKLSSKKRSLAFERVMEQMEKDDIVERVTQTTGKYKKLQWQFIEKDEEL